MRLYIHVPFCRRKCLYCAFKSEALIGSPSDSALRLRTYMDTLLMELSQWGNALGRCTIDSVFFGGGTPSLLPVQAFEKIFERMRQAFIVPTEAEITMEGNPESMNDRAVLRQLRALGINRLSMGVQSLHDAHLEALGRIHRASEAIDAYYRAREAGFSNINIDLMWGLPGQTISQWLQTVKAARDLAPEHISAYGLTLEEGTPLADAAVGGRLRLPDERSLSMMYMEGSALFEEKGLVQYEISNYARTGRFCRHNNGYWEQEDYIGLGPAATSTFMGRRWTNLAILGQWSKAVLRRHVSPRPRGDEKPLAFIDTLPTVEHLDFVTHAKELIMLRLRTVRGLRLRDYRDVTGRDLTALHPKLFQALRQNDLIRILNGSLRLTRKGMLVSNSILSALIEREEQPLLSMMAEGNIPEPVIRHKETIQL